MVDRSLRRFQNELSGVAELRTRADIRKERSVEPSYACQAVSNSLRHLRAQTGAERWGLDCHQQHRWVGTGCPQMLCSETDQFVVPVSSQAWEPAPTSPWGFGIN